VARFGPTGDCDSLRELLPALRVIRSSALIIVYIGKIAIDFPKDFRNRRFSVLSGVVAVGWLLVGGWLRRRVTAGDWNYFRNLAKIERFGSDGD